MSPTASSAALVMFEVGALTTMTPLWVAALTSTLSRPTPARATTLSCFAAASASASIFVADRTRTASASGSADSSSVRSAPLQFRISKSGPSAEIVAGLSSSAISTTGLLTSRVLTGGVASALHDAVPGTSTLLEPTGSGRCVSGGQLDLRGPVVGQVVGDTGEARPVELGVLADQRGLVAHVEPLVS